MTDEKKPTEWDVRWAFLNSLTAWGCLRYLLTRQYKKTRKRFYLNPKSSCNSQSEALRDCIPPDWESFKKNRFSSSLTKAESERINSVNLVQCTVWHERYHGLIRTGIGQFKQVAMRMYQNTLYLCYGAKG